MTYLISDIHGCYAEYKELLSKINFTDNDDLYVLGDAMDRGAEPIRVMLDLMARPNVAYIIGNHDYMMLLALKKLCVEVTEENCESHLTLDDMMSYCCWMEDGGQTTAEQFRKLTHEQQQDIIDYLEDASVYEILEHEENGQVRQFVLVHAGIKDFDEEKELDDYDFSDFIFQKTDYCRRCFRDENTYLVTGHTPTMSVRPDGKPLIYQGNGHIAIDCGCVFGGQLAAYCIETGEAFYVPGHSEADEAPLICNHYPL